MNFSSDSVKLEIRPHKEDFYLDVETPHGHFFAVLDFAPHDYVNLTPALKRRLEMVVASFASPPKFSADLFLGFQAEEINNFLNNLSKQSDSPPLLCSAALCLVSGNQLSYFLSGDVLLNILAGGRLQPLSSAESGGESYPEQLGARNLETPLTSQVKSLTLNDGDTVLIMTQGVGKTFNQKQLAREVMSLGTSDPKVIRDALLAASSASRSDRTVVVISGPYTRSGNPTLADLSRAVASLEFRLNALSDSSPASGIVVGALKGGEEISGANYADTEVAKPVPVIDQVRSNYRSVAVGAVLITLAIALVGGFAGSWFQSRMVRQGPEVWSVRTSGSQISIARLDESNPSTVTLSLEQPAKTTGEQKFSSFTDVKQYLEMISRPSTASNQPSQQNQAAPTTAVGQSVPATENKPAAFVVEYRARPGDSLMKLAWRHQVSPEKLKELNPNIVSWRSIKIGQKIALPSPTPANQQASPQGELVGSANSGTNTTEVTVGPGDSVMKIARRHNVSQEEIRKLNPNIVRWPLIQIGQRISLPARGPTPANSPATSQVQQTSASPATSEVQQPSASPATSPVQPPSSPNVAAGTKQVRVGRGESLNALALRYSTTPRRLKLLNPRIRNWASIQPGQKVVVPAPGS